LALALMGGASMLVAQAAPLAPQANTYIVSREQL
jgi:hypothetical protein